MDERLARRGFALITVLAVLAAIGGVALAATSLGRDEFNASMNRIALERAWWAAEGCAAQIQSVVADSLVAAGDEPGAQDAVWRALDRVIGTVRLSDTSCTFDAEATGSRLDVNTATEEELDRLFEALGLGGESNALRDALLDWIDTDSVARPNGAEVDWYRAQLRPLPRNGPLADVRELTRIRGFESLASIEPFLSTENSRICITTATAPVLSAIPTFSPAIVDHILEMRASGEAINELSDVLADVPQTDVDSAMARFPEIQSLTTLDPDGWLVTIQATIRSSSAAIVVEKLLEREGSRPVVTRTRILP